jgi:hypothetical protein
MTLKEKLETHIGGLVCLKEQLFWYDNRGRERNKGRVCLILDVYDARNDLIPRRIAAHVVDAQAPVSGTVDMLLLIDGSPKWVWASEGEVEIIQ